MSISPLQTSDSRGFESPTFSFSLVVSSDPSSSSLFLLLPLPGPVVVRPPLSSRTSSFLVVCVYDDYWVHPTPNSTLVPRTVDLPVTTGTPFGLHLQVTLTSGLLYLPPLNLERWLYRDQHLKHISLLSPSYQRPRLSSSSNYWM